jgi:predicted nucleotidyltransferase
LLYEEIPPIEFAKIYPNIGLHNDLVSRIQELIRLKSTISEAYFHHGEADLLAFIRDCIQESEEKRHLLPSSKGTTETLNILLRKYVK